MRDTPKDVQAGPYGFEPQSANHFLDSGQPDETLDPQKAVDLARQAYISSTNWINASRRAAWNNNSRAFQSLHPQGSKYLSSGFTHRSTLYRPKTRAMVRRDEAATASAFFANEDVVSIQAADDDDPMQQASAEAIKAILQYRLTKTIPWFLTVVGARQDCDVMGVCVLKPYWKYEERLSHYEPRMQLDEKGQLVLNMDGTVATENVGVYKKIHDKPVVDMLAPENIRIEPGADWRDPVNTSPYIIELAPFYMNEVRLKMARKEWLPVAESTLRAATDLDDDVTRRTREQGRIPGKDDDAWKPHDFSICWTRINIIKFGGRDWHYITVASTGELLTNPRPLEEVYLHGIRPYILGQVVIETHKTYPSGKVELIRDLQRATNDDLNLRFDNLKLNLNPRQFVRAGVAADVRDLTTFIPGKTVIVNSKPGVALNTDIVWDRPPPAGPEGFAEQDRLNLDLDEMTGSFSNSSTQSSQITEQSATGMHLMSGEASGMTEYELRLFAETAIEPCIRHLIKLIQAYETDPIVLSLAGKTAQLRQKFGIDAITDELLNQEVTTRVNVGIGATNPALKLRNFVMGAQALGQMYGAQIVAQGSNFEEVAKEVFGLLGYKDGKRFFQAGFDPRVAQLQQQIQKMQGAAQGKEQAPPDTSKVQAAQITTQGRLQEEQLKARTDIMTAQIDLQKDREANQAENWRAVMQARREAEQDHFHAQREDQRMQQERAQQAQQQAMGPPQHAMAQLAPGHTTTFENGQRWGLRQGKAMRVA